MRQKLLLLDSTHSILSGLCRYILSVSLVHTYQVGQFRQVLLLQHSTALVRVSPKVHDTRGACPDMQPGSFLSACPRAGWLVVQGSRI